MFFGMGTQVMALALQLFYNIFKIRIAIKVSCEEKRSFGLFALQCACDELTTVSVSVASKDDRYFFVIYISLYNCAVVISQGFFFTSCPSLSFAASK